MSAPQHTPGPWTVPGQPDKICASGYTKNGAAKVVATVHTPSWMGHDEPYANARLIAAAPDLLALAELVHGSFGGGLTITFSERDVAEFAAVITKAKGVTA